MQASRLYSALYLHGTSDSTVVGRSYGWDKPRSFVHKAQILHAWQSVAVECHSSSLFARVKLYPDLTKSVKTEPHISSTTTSHFGYSSSVDDIYTNPF